jgi:hypothetical protein
MTSDIILRISYKNVKIINKCNLLNKNCAEFTCHSIIQKNLLEQIISFKQWNKIVFVLYPRERISNIKIIIIINDLFEHRQQQ